MPGLRMREGTWDAALVREAGAENRYGLPDRFPEGAIVLDVGAHIGGFAVAAAGRGAVVWAFEPDPENFAMAEENTAELREAGRIRLARAAVWRSDRPAGTVRFHPLRRREPPWGVQTGAGTCCVATTSAAAVAVPTVSLDEILREAGRVALMKLDCEFAEYPILLTSRELARVDRIAAEFHETTAPVDPEAAVGGIRRFRGEHLAGCLLSQGFELAWDRRTPSRGYFQARRLGGVLAGSDLRHEPVAGN